MGRNVQVAGVAFLVVAGLGALGACDRLAPWSKFEDDATAGKVSSVRLDLRSGGVTLRGKPGLSKVSVHREVEYQGDRPEGATHKVEGGALVLKGCGEDCKVRYTVDVPAGVPVSGKTSSGSVSVSAVGAVDVSTNSGRITMDGVDGAVHARTSNGRIKGTGLRGTVQAQTSNGEIVLAPATPQDVRAKTSNGGITVTVPGGRYQVAAKTNNGDKKVGIADDPGGAHKLDLTTSNGGITVRAA